MPRSKSEWQREANRANARLRAFSKTGVTGEIEQLVRHNLMLFYERNPGIAGVNNMRPDEQLTVTASTKLTKAQQEELSGIISPLFKSKSGSVNYYLYGGKDKGTFVSYKAYLKHHNMKEDELPLQDYIDLVDNFHRAEQNIGATLYQHIGTDDAVNIDKVRESDFVTEDTFQMTRMYLKTGMTGSLRLISMMDPMIHWMKETADLGTGPETMSTSESFHIMMQHLVVF